MFANILREIAPADRPGRTISRGELAKCDETGNAAPRGHLFCPGARFEGRDWELGSGNSGAELCRQVFCTSAKRMCPIRCRLAVAGSNGGGTCAWPWRWRSGFQGNWHGERS
jgi:hypothetical protein